MGTDQTFMNAFQKKGYLIVALKLIVFVLGATASWRFIADHWYVGPIFGTVVLVWHVKALKDLIKPRAISFLVFSTLIYALVIWSHDLLESIYLAVAVGTILLTLAHKILLVASWRRLFVAIPSIYGIWFLFGKLLEYLEIISPLQFFLNYVTVWQAAYLFFLLGPFPLLDGRPKDKLSAVV